MFTGGALSNFSIFAIGIMPYITASIIVQLLALDIIPAVSEWKRQGNDGEKKMKKLTYQLTFVFAIAQSIGLSLGFNKMMYGIVDEGWWNYVVIAACLTLGTAILLVFAEIIERKGIGKGVSMIIAAGILMVMPTQLYQLYETFVAGGSALSFPVISKFVILGLVIFAILLVIIQVQRGERRIPITTSMTGSNTRSAMLKNNQSYLPIKMNPAGVIPVIFASALFAVPQTIAMLFPNMSGASWILTNVTYNNPIGMAIFAALIIGFTFFYGFVTMNPEKMAENLQHSSAYIPGVRPGKETQDRLKKILKHLLFLGAIFLGILAILPLILGNSMGIASNIMIGGTSLIIIVSVFVDLKDQSNAVSMKQNYTGFINKGEKKRR